MIKRSHVAYCRDPRRTLHWLLEWVDADDVRNRRAFASKAEAEAARAGLLDRGEIPPMRRGRLGGGLHSQTQPVPGTTKPSRPVAQPDASQVYKAVVLDAYPPEGWVAKIAILMRKKAGRDRRKQAAQD